MCAEKTLILSFTAGSVSVADARQGIDNRQHAGFSLVELIITLAIVAVVTGLVVIGIEPILRELRANRAVYQIIASLSEARMLAMSQDRMVSLQFPSDNNGVRKKIEAKIWNKGGGCTGVTGDCWEEVSSDAGQRKMDPSIALENDHIFSRNNLAAPPRGSAMGDIVFGGTSIIETHRIVVTPDGFMTFCGNSSNNATCDLDTPVNGTLFIGTTNGNDKLARAVTVHGATGGVVAWQWRKDVWVKAR